jgi:NAD+ kinase
MPELQRIALVVHPARDLSKPLEALLEWTRAHAADVGQIRVHADGPEVAPVLDAADADLIVALGGDGTVLSALRRGAAAGRPVLGVACGSLGALAAVAADGVAAALDRFTRGDWDAHRLPALRVQARDGDAAVDALNDLVVVRAGAGQLRVSVALDGVPYGRWSGDGIILATSLGSSAYTMAAGGPLLAPDTPGSVCTPLNPHGGALPPLVAGAGTRWEVEIGEGYGGARVEVDGQPSEAGLLAFTAELHEGFAELVRLGHEEPFLSALRRRGLLADSPRMLVEKRRRERKAAQAAEA